MLEIVVRVREGRMGACLDGCGMRLGEGRAAVAAVLVGVVGTKAGAVECLQPRETTTLHNDTTVLCLQYQWVIEIPERSDTIAVRPQHDSLPVRLRSSLSRRTLRTDPVGTPHVRAARRRTASEGMDHVSLSGGRRARMWERWDRHSSAARRHLP